MRARLVWLTIASAVGVGIVFGSIVRRDSDLTDRVTSPLPRNTSRQGANDTRETSATVELTGRERFDVGAEGPFVVAKDGVWAFSRRDEGPVRLIYFNPRTGELSRGGIVRERNLGDILVLRKEIWTVSNRWDDSGGPSRGAIQRWDRRTPTPIDTRVFRGIPNELDATRSAVWVTVPGGEGPDDVWMMDRSTGRITRRIEVGAEASGILATESAVWVADSIDGGIWEIDPISAQVLGKVRTRASCPNEMALHRKIVWVVTCDGLIKIDPDTREILAEIRLKGAVTDIAFGLGRLCALDVRGDVLVGIDPDSGELTGDRIEIPNADSPPSDLQAGNGSLYVTSVDGLVTRITR